MSEKQVFIVRTSLIKANALEAVRAMPVPMTPADKPLVVEVKPLTRSLDQNARFHAICGDMAKRATYGGRRLTLLQWKTLLISAHSIATGRGADLVIGMEGEVVNIRESSADMGVARMASLIEYTTAYCVQNNIRLYSQPEGDSTNA